LLENQCESFSENENFSKTFPKMIIFGNKNNFDKASSKFLQKLSRKRKYFRENEKIGLCFNRSGPSHVLQPKMMF
jgi:hypothetical protein